MTEKEYIIEMLCSTTKDNLIRRLQGDKDLPDWLLSYDESIVEEALAKYDIDVYKKMREEQEKYL